jgi:hypothetical protein
MKFAVVQQQGKVHLTLIYLVEEDTYRSDKYSIDNV